MDFYVLGQRTALEKFAGSRFSKFLRTAPTSKIGPAVEDAFGSAAPTYYKNFETNRLLRSLRSGTQDVNRENLVKAVRARLKGGFPEELNTKLERSPRDISFAKTFKERANSPLVPILHGGTEPELRSILKYGPNGAIPMAPGASGRNELGGFFVHKPTDPLADRALSAYGQGRALHAGGSPAVLEGEIPEGLLSARGRLGGGEHVLPASLWKYVKNPRVRSLPPATEPL